MTDYPTLAPGQYAERLTNRAPVLAEIVRNTLAGIAAGNQPETCGHDFGTVAAICHDDRLVRCLWCNDSHRFQHVETDARVCQECVEHRPGVVEVVNATEHRWIYDPDRPAVRLFVGCLMVCTACDWGRR